MRSLIAHAPKPRRLFVGAGGHTVLAVSSVCAIAMLRCTLGGSRNEGEGQEKSPETNRIRRTNREFGWKSGQQWLLWKNPFRARIEFVGPVRRARHCTVACAMRQHAMEFIPGRRRIGSEAIPIRPLVCLVNLPTSCKPNIVSSVSIGSRPVMMRVIFCCLAIGLCAATASAQFTARQTINVTGTGHVDTELDYVPNVVKCENGLASFEALKAQAVAARTFAYYKMNLQGFINDGTSDQVYSCAGSATAIHLQAAAATEGEVLYIRDNVGAQSDVLIAAFYVAGAIPTGPFNPAHPSAVPNPGDSDPTSTQQWVTYPYESGHFGGSNLGTPLGFQGTPSNPNWPNRGAKSQNGADFLSDNSISYVDILKYYYGADIQLRTVDTTGTSVTYAGEKVLTNFDNYRDRSGSITEGHEGYFGRSLEYSGSTTANVAGSTAERTSAEAQSGTDSQLLTITYDETSGSDFLVRHVAAARFSDYDNSAHVAERVSNLQFDASGSVGFWLKTADPGLQVSLALDDPTTGDRGVLRNVIADNAWHRYEWNIANDLHWEAWAGGNGTIDGEQVSLDSIHLIGNTDALVYLDTIFWSPHTVDINGDFDGNGQHTCNDVDLLVAEIASGNFNSAMDLNSDGMLDPLDLGAWLAEAGAANLASGEPYLPGDSDLNGVVDGSDFLQWNANKFTPAVGFCMGDFNADGVVDGRDFLVWNQYKFTTSNRSVPEPLTGVWGIVLLVAVGTSSRRFHPLGIVG